MSSLSEVSGSSTAIAGTPFDSSTGTTLSQHQAPCHAPCTSTTVLLSPMHRASHNGEPSFEEDALRVVGRQRDRALVRQCGVGVPPEPSQQVSACRVEEVHPVERGGQG